MFVGSKLKTDKTIKEKASDKINDYDSEATTVFKDLHISAFSKAASISPNVKSVTLGEKFEVNEEKDIPLISNKNDSVSNSDSPTFYSTTPEHIKSNDSNHTKLKKRTNCLIPSSLDPNSDQSKHFSYQKLLIEYDTERRLTVDKVMRERIKNMHDTEKLIRESLENLKQTKQEEVIARRLLLEQKILDDIHEQEVLNKPKREAQWAKENLKEAQRVQERNQKVKEAEEEARKKSEAILLKRKQIDKIFELRKEYNQEYKNMLETLKMCKDKAALTELSTSQSKILKDCTMACENLLKKCKENDVNEDDVNKAKNLVETVKSIHEHLYNEIVKLNESLNNEKNKDETVENKNVEDTKKNENEVNESVHTQEISSSTPIISSNLDKLSPIQQSGLSSASGRSYSSLTSVRNRSLKSVSFVGTNKFLAKKDRTPAGFFSDLEKNESKCLQQKKFTSKNSNDLYQKSVTKRARNQCLYFKRKMNKKVRFSESSELIEPRAFSLLVDDKENQEMANETSVNYRLAKFSQSNLPKDLEGNAESAHLSDCFDSRSLKVYLNLKSHLENYEKTIAPLLTNEDLKKFRFSCQKAVTIPVNAISPLSGSHLTDKFLKLHNLLSGRTVEVGDIKITASQHPLGVAYCKYLLAKKFVRQGDLTVSSKPDAAFSIAAVLASLWVDFPDFGELVLGYFQTACPYLAPVFMPQVEGQTDEDYHKSLGYTYSQNGEVEKQDSFLKRMSGIMRLYSAVIISKVRQPGKMNPLGLSEGWRWISALLNLEPRPDICATLLYDFLEVAGNEMFRAYSEQFKKLLAYICQEYFPKLEKVTPAGAGGPLVRLEGFLQKILKEESISPPNGVLHPNFW